MEKRDIIFWLFLGLAVILLVWMMRGHSPGMETIVAGLIASNAALLTKIYGHGRELSKISVNVEIIKLGKTKGKK